MTAGKPKLRLEWIAAGSLSENPLNWRRHSQGQLQSIRDLLSDPDVGWAGACLYNERTHRLIDGHARRTVVDPDTPVPVLVGDWSEEAEKKILATLDPVGAMAQGDAEAYAKLVETVQAESLWVRDLLHNTQADLTALAEANGEPVELVEKKIYPPPVMTWVLIGIPTIRFGEIASTVEAIAAKPGIMCEVTANHDEGK